MNTATNTTFAPFMPGMDREEGMISFFTAKAGQAQNADEARSLLGFAEKITGGLGRLGVNLFSIIQDAVARSLNGDVAASLDSRRELPSSRDVGSTARGLEMGAAIGLNAKSTSAKKAEAARMVVGGHILSPAMAMMVALDLANHTLPIEAIDYTKTNLNTTLRLSGPAPKGAIAIEMDKKAGLEDKRFNVAPSSHVHYRHSHCNTPHASLEIKAAENAQFCTGAFKAQKLNVSNLDGLVSPINGVEKAQFSFASPKNPEDQANIFSGANLNPSQKPLFGGFDKGPLGMASFTVANGPKFGL